MILYRKESDLLQQELDALLAKKEEAIATLLQEKAALENGKEKTLLAIGQEAYTQYLNNSNECDLLAYFENVQAIEGRLVEKDACIAQTAANCDQEIAALQARVEAAKEAPAPAPVVPSVAPVVPAVEMFEAVAQETPVVEHVVEETTEPEEIVAEEPAIEPVAEEIPEPEMVVEEPAVEPIVEEIVEEEPAVEPIVEEVPVPEVMAEEPVSVPAPFMAPPAEFVPPVFHFGDDEEATIVLPSKPFIIKKELTCKNCGKTLQEGDCFCDQCGTRVSE